MKYLEACKFTELLQEYADQYHLYRTASDIDNFRSPDSKVEKLAHKVDKLKEKIWKSLNVDKEV